MKIKDRPLTPLLIKQIKRQEERIKACGQQASLDYITLLPRLNYAGTIYSTRFKNIKCVGTLDRKKLFFNQAMADQEERFYKEKEKNFPKLFI